MIQHADIHGIPEPVRGAASSRIDVSIPSHGKTPPPDTGPPRAMQHQGTWQDQVIGLAVDGAREAARATVAELKSGPPGGGRLLAAVSLVLSIVANLGLVGFVVLHQIGTSQYEVATSNANAALTTQLSEANTALTAQAAALTAQAATQAAANEEFRKELAGQREELGAQRRAIYGLIDVLADSNPKARSVERDLLQH